MSKALRLLPPQSLVWPNNPLLSDADVEVRNTIIQRHGPFGLFSIDALADNGWLRMLAFECEEGKRREIIQRLVETPLEWNKPRTTVFVGFGSKEPSTLPLSPAPTNLSEENVEPQIQNEWMFSADEILNRLEDSSAEPQDRISAVLFAETTSFSGVQTSRLLPALFKFCVENRFSKSDEIITTVGAAIRKFAMNMPISEFEHYSTLFLPTATETLSCDIELELAKAVGWRLARIENVNAGEFQNLEARLSELASDYLTQRLILQENYASIAMHAVIAVALMNGTRQDEFVDRIARLGIDWFRTLFGSRLIDVARKRQDSSTRESHLVRLLRRLETAGH